MAQDPEKLRRRRQRDAEERRSDYDMVNAIRGILDLDPIFENNARRGHRAPTPSARQRS